MQMFERKNKKILSGGNKMINQTMSLPFATNLKKFNKNEKGLTLLELLAVIVILGIIAIIAIPSISAVIHNTERKAARANAHQLIESARLMVAANGFEKSGHQPAGSTGIQDIEIDELVAAGFLSANPTDSLKKPDTYNEKSSYVHVIKSTTKEGDNYVDKYAYQVSLRSNDGTRIYFDLTPEEDIDSTTSDTINLQF